MAHLHPDQSTSKLLTRQKSSLTSNVYFSPNRLHRRNVHIPTLYSVLFLSHRSKNTPILQIKFHNIPIFFFRSPDITFLSTFISSLYGGRWWMARTNKYTSLNFNDIYEKKTKPTSRPNSSSSSSSSSNNKTIISNSRIHGHMLVLSRPTPKPISIPQPQPGQIHQQQQQQPNKLQSSPPVQKTRAEPESDSISLRPQGRTGSGSGAGSGQTALPSLPLQSPLQKSNRFVPPHLRPGFVGREEKPVPGQGVRGRPEVVGPGPGPGIHQHHHNQGHIGSSPNRYGENGRPKSGGGYERMNRDSMNFMNRPRSSGARPSSSG